MQDIGFRANLSHVVLLLSSLSPMLWRSSACWGSAGCRRTTTASATSGRGRDTGESLRGLRGLRGSTGITVAEQGELRGSDWLREHFPEALRSTQPWSRSPVCRGHRQRQRSPAQGRPGGQRGGGGWRPGLRCRAGVVCSNVRLSASSGGQGSGARRRRERAAAAELWRPHA